MLGTILLIIITTFFLYCLYRILIQYKPQIIANKNGEIIKILQKMKTLQKTYHPTPWLFNNHLQSIWGLRLRGRSSYKPRKEDVIFKDGGEVTIEYFENENLPSDAPIVFIIHTFCGSSRESCTNYMSTYLMKNKYRVVICSLRGCNGSKIKTRKLYNAYQTDDLKAIMNHVYEKYPNPKGKFLIGFSLGSMITTQYGIDYDDMDGIVCVSHPINGILACQELAKSLNRKLYLDPIMKNIKHIVAKNPFMEKEIKEKVYKTQNINEYDDLVTIYELGFKSHIEYYEVINVQQIVDRLKVPCLYIMSEDDPFIKADWIPLERLEKAKYSAFILTKEGGHVGFCQNWDGKIAYSELVTLDFFKNIKN